MAREIPILMQTEMVRATLAFLKTITRRELSRKKWIINDEPDRYKFHGLDDNGAALFEDLHDKQFPWMSPIPCPYGLEGDLLWVRETFFLNGDEYIYLADGTCCEQFEQCECIEIGKPKWKPSIHMPKISARIWLEVERIRMERVQDITDEDALLEGIKKIHHGRGQYYYHHKNSEPHGHNWSYPDRAFQDLWVWVIKFKVVSTTGKQNIKDKSGFINSKPAGLSLKSSLSGDEKKLANEARQLPRDNERKEVSHG
jgi:hypothetical protein